eukprot:CAMPEP_0172546206 /NCGR_PEP_ID=MMETSP1067-20121228/16000_1 /TAXON_ID=265564 ORGANISM="Thalassiosira punctigera, Strain Tpunct2005C2" /NCGR_SAMPLE_ID=MMETSP1067 /ASSEMBLY_ACC=CAM_ASM_000444 /LENGTH=894 /DNA_ID=CAMNT_0013333099 /DNA_START=107 /DNA_END=2791 /DNA_ORIENTATION=+
MGSSSSTSRGNTVGSHASASAYPAARNRRATSAPPSVATNQHRDRRRTTTGTAAAASSAPPTLHQRHHPVPRSSILPASAASSSLVPHGRVVAGSNASVPGSSIPPASAASPPAGGSSATALSRPGAYSISREGAGPTQVFRVQIPHEVRPGQEFQVIAGSRTVRVRCPVQSRGGHYLQITVPPDPVVRPNVHGMAVLTSATPGMEGGGAVAMRESVRDANAEVLRGQEDRQQQGQEASGSSPANSQASQQQQGEQPQPTTYMVTVPPGISPGMQFAVEVEGQRMMVTCPDNVAAGMNLRILPPQRSPIQSAPPNLPSGIGTSVDRPPEEQSSVSTPPISPPLMQMFEVVVPPGVMPNQSFSLLANGQRVLVTCPPNVRPGQKVRFQLPISNPNEKSKDAPAVQLEYESIKDGWARTIRVTDMKFQWVRMNEDGEIDLKSVARFDVQHSAYTRRLTFLEGNDPRMRTGKLSFGAANESSVESSVELNGKEVVGYAEIAAAHQRGTYEEKAEWFQEICRERLRTKWENGHMRILVRRNHLLHDSLNAVMGLGRMELAKIWRFEFLGETGIDAGGLAREWFQLVTEQIFNPDMGLWLPSATNQMAMRINPASEISCPEDHLIYFRFLGRVMGKALFDGQLVSGHMVRHLYKHILGWPVMFEDLELPDEEYFNSLKSLLDVENMEDLCMDFTFTENALGENRVVELTEGGEEVPVTNDNLPEFLEANLKYHLMDRVKPQMTEMLLGFFDVIPEPLLTIFDFQELELLMCGVPVIDIDDWMANTTYTGHFQHKGAGASTVQWFWEVIREEFDQETRARLLQFVTGTSGVPSRGFSVLQGNDGSIRQFCIHGIKKENSLYPRSHTCFNRLDLPIYGSKNELREKLKVAIATSATGFDIE